MELENEPDGLVAQFGELVLRQARSASPSMSTSPLLGRSKVPRMLSRVVLPLPEAPMIELKEPFSNPRLIVEQDLGA